MSAGWASVRNCGFAGALAVPECKKKDLPPCASRADVLLMEPDTLLEDVVRDFSTSRDRLCDDILKRLEDVGFASLADWAHGSAAARNACKLPAVLEEHIDSMCGSLADNTGEEQLCYTATIGAHLVCMVGKTDVWCEREAPLATFLSLFREQVCKTTGCGESSQPPLHMEDADGFTLTSNTLLHLAMVPGHRLVAGTPFRVAQLSLFKAIDGWLDSLALSCYVSKFLENCLDDFFAMLFLKSKDLDDIHIQDQQHKKILIASVKSLQVASPSKLVSLLVRYLGFPECCDEFEQNGFTLASLPCLLDEQLASIKALGPSRKLILLDLIKQYCEYTSIEATHGWLVANGFGTFAFQFVRYNIPFYALPILNFFIINEMGSFVDAQDMSLALLLQELEGLKDQPAYNVKAIACWLRDLDLEDHFPVFSQHLFVNFIEALTIMTDQTIARLVKEPQDRLKLQKSVDDMKDIKCFFSATSTLLKDDIVKQHAHRFAQHGLPLDCLVHINEDVLKDIGVVNPAHRKHIIWAIERISKDLPASSSNLSMLFPGMTSKHHHQAEFMSSSFVGAAQPAPPTNKPISKRAKRKQKQLSQKQQAAKPVEQ